MGKRIPSSVPGGDWTCCSFDAMECKVDLSWRDVPVAKCTAMQMRRREKKYNIAECRPAISVCRSGWLDAFEEGLDCAA